ncbi:MAG: DNA polymerase III subunit delta [Bacillota bacterium]|nr:DNA polymerase III subunit delta [Bacillota bacterium]
MPGTSSRAGQGGRGLSRSRARRGPAGSALESLEELLEEIRGRGPAPLYLAYGAERSLVRRLEEALLEALGLRDPAQAALGHRRLDGRELALGELLRQARWLPLGASRQLLVVEGPAWLETAPSEAEMAALERYLATAPAPSPTVLLLEPSGEPDRRKRLVRLLVERGRVLEAAPLQGAQLAEAARAWCRRRGRRLAPEAALLLGERVAGGLDGLVHELEKLDVALEPGAPIDTEALLRLTPLRQEASVFELVDAVVEGGAGRALRLFRRLQAEGEPPARLLALVARQFRLIGQLQAAQRDGRDPAAAVGVHPYVLRKVTEQARLVDARRLLEALRAIEEADLAVKTGRREESEAAELALARIALSSPRRSASGSR